MALLVVLVVGVALAGTHFSNSSELPHSDSSAAYSLLATSGSMAASQQTGTIVWTTASGSATGQPVKATITRMLARVSSVPGVASVTTPFTAAGATQVSSNGRIAYATVAFSSTKNTATVEGIVKDTSTKDLTIQTGGQQFTSQTPSETGEMVGILAALVVLLLVFRSVVAAVLPIATGIAGVAISSLGVLLLSHVVSLSSVSLSLGALIGLGVGIDYALLIVSRHVRALRDGDRVQTAITTAMNTSGRSVIFAGGTVIVALLGMLVLGFGFLSGLGIAAALTVLVTVGAAVTLLPALLSIAGPRALRRTERTGWQPGQPILSPEKVVGNANGRPREGLWARWAQIVARRPLVTSAAALALMLLLASPVLSMRLGSADTSSDRSGSSTRTFYDTMAEGFGKGYDADLLVVAKIPDQQARVAWTNLVRALPSTTDVETVSTPSALSGNSVSLVTVQPKTASQDAATSALVTHLRSDLIRRAEQGTDLQVHVGGTTASTIDYANALTSKIPIYLALIAALGFVLLTVAFRSLLVPLIGALSNLLSIGVALGATVAIFQWAWGPSFFGIGGTAPVEYIVAMLIISVIFGLSMDYQVFLAGRVREEWIRTEDNDAAVTAGVANTGKVIATAAAIMFCVFISFGFAGLRTASEFGVGLAIAVPIDALLMRMTIIPAIMRVCGRRNWALPGWLDRILPRISVEGPVEAATAHVGQPRVLAGTGHPA